MTNTGKVLIIGLLVIDAGVAGYLLFPKEDRPPAVTGTVTGSGSSAAAVDDSRVGQTRMAAGAVARTTPDDSGAEKLAALKPVAPAAPAVPVAPVAPVVSIAPASTTAGAVTATTTMAPAAATPPPAPAITTAPAAPAVATASNVPPAAPQAATGSRPATRTAIAATGVQKSARTKSKPTVLHAEQTRGRKPDDQHRGGSKQVSAALTAQLVKESAKPDPSLPLPPAGSGLGPGGRSSNPVASAMTDQLVRESSKVNLSSPAQSYKH
jgi:hypothetical protein